MIIALTGKAGSGKSTTAEYLCKHHNFTHISSRAFLEKELRKKNLPATRKNLEEIAVEIINLHGPTSFVERLLARAKEVEGNAVIESIRTLKGAEYLLGKGITLWNIQTDEDVRYERIKNRGLETDNVSLKEFSTMNQYDLDTVTTLASITLHNTGTLSELYKQVENILAEES